MKNLSPEFKGLAAVVLGAGLSNRMHENKLLLPWKQGTIIEWVISQLQEAGLDQIVVVTGRDNKTIEALTSYPKVMHAFNQQFADGEMLHSLQCGISVLSADIKALLVVLGDQPQIEVQTIQNVTNAYIENEGKPLVVPSFQNRRGHPWMIGKELWNEILEMEPPDNLRAFLTRHANDILYVVVTSDSILSDIDTPQDYQDAMNSGNGK
jgi:molybdenum cofactor cytidylyltransferase